MDWNRINWTILERLRAGYLDGTAADGPYWRSMDDLANYDFTYGERIGWKWDAVIGELRTRGWTPPPGNLLDWGCGSGIAGRRILHAFGPDRFSGMRLWDHSALAREFATDSVRNAFPGLKVAAYAPGESTGLLVLSHVLNELNAESLDELMQLVRSAQAVIWVEPGTHAVSRQLAAIRDRLRNDFNLIAPCTHANNCPLFTTENARHWCHFFAPAPGGIFADSNWVRFGQHAGVDLRSLPYCWLVLEKASASGNAQPLEDTARLIGRARAHKAHADLLLCDNTGLHDLKLFKRTNPALHKALDRKPPLPLYKCAHDGKTLVRLEPLHPKTTAPDA